jgi:hypothetical protein
VGVVVILVVSDFNFQPMQLRNDPHGFSRKESGYAVAAFFLKYSGLEKKPKLLPSNVDYVSR